MRLLKVFAVAMTGLRTDLLDGKVERESIVDVMMLVERDRDSVVDLAGDVLPSSVDMYSSKVLSRMNSLHA